MKQYQQDYYPEETGEYKEIVTANSPLYASMTPDDPCEQDALRKDPTVEFFELKEDPVGKPDELWVVRYTIYDIYGTCPGIERFETFYDYLTFDYQKAQAYVNTLHPRYYSVEIVKIPFRSQSL